jgi:hypothetical protein
MVTSSSTITEYVRCLLQRRSIYTISQDRQCTMTCHFGGFCVTLIAVETQWRIFVFPHKLIKLQDFWEKIIERKLYVLVYSTILIEIFLILKIINREIFINYVGLHVKCPLFLSYFNQTWISSTFNKSPNIKFYDIHPVKTELFHVQRQAWLAKSRF